MLEDRRLFNAVAGLTLYNADTDQPIGALVDGAVLNFRTLQTTHLNVRADADSSAKSVRFSYDSNSKFRTESGTPFVLAGNDGDDYRSWTPALGNHVIGATPYTKSDAGGTKGSTFTVNFSVIDQAPAVPNTLGISVSSIPFGQVTTGQSSVRQVTLTNTGAAGDPSITVSATLVNGATSFTDDFDDVAGLVLAPGASRTINVRFAPADVGAQAATMTIQHTGVNAPSVVQLAGSGVAPVPSGRSVGSLTLINSSTDQPIGTMVDGMTINLAQSGEKLNIRADTSPLTVGSVKFTLDGKKYAVDNSSPYSIGGDSSGDYKTWTPSVGTHTLTVMPYASKDAKGSEGTPLTLTFRVISGEELAPPDQVHLSWTASPTTSMTVVWHTLLRTVPHVAEYRKSGDATWLSATGTAKSSGTKGQLHQVNMTSLTPDTAYEYRVAGPEGSWSDAYAFKTAPTPGTTDFNFTYFADTGIIGREDGLAKGTQQAIDEMTALHCDLVLAGGDYAYFDTDKRFGTIDNTIDAWFNQMQPLFASTPVLPTYGNHEVHTDGDDLASWLPRFAVFNGAENNSSYSFNVDGVHFVSLLTGLRDTDGIPNARLTWLKNDLATAQAAGYKWIIPYTHNAAFADGSSHPSNITLRQQLAPLFEKYGVKVALASHDQSYERTLPIINGATTPSITDTHLTGYDQNDGVTWLKISPAGKMSSKGEDFSRFQHNPPQYPTAFRDDTMFHYSTFTITAAGELKVQTYGFTGDGVPSTVIDQFTYTIAG